MALETVSVEYHITREPFHKRLGHGGTCRVAHLVAHPMTEERLNKMAEHGETHVNVFIETTQRGDLSTIQDFIHTIMKTQIMPIKDALDLLKAKEQTWQNTQENIG